ncbi:MAG: hypothetical protein E3K37_11535 [Candidatus Kuenenia sp.]|nr:hypothetical protein [Candidatus Kuenenia hertensis]
MKIIKYSLLCLVLKVSLCSMFSNAVFASASGPDAYRAGSPGDVGTCNASGCHATYTTDSGDAEFSISGPSDYTPGKTIKLKVAFSNFSGEKRGFEMTAVDADGNRVGKFKKIGNTTQVIPAGDYRGLDKSDKNKYIEHTFKGTKKKNWKVKWTAPTDATDPITFYAAGVDADGKGSEADDSVYTATLEMSAK